MQSTVHRWSPAEVSEVEKYARDKTGREPLEIVDQLLREAHEAEAQRHLPPQTPTSTQISFADLIAAHNEVLSGGLTPSVMKNLVDGYQENRIDEREHRQDLERLDRQYKYRKRRIRFGVYGAIAKTVATLLALGVTGGVGIGIFHGTKDATIDSLARQLQKKHAAQEHVLTTKQAELDTLIENAQRMYWGELSLTEQTSHELSELEQRYFVERLFPQSGKTVMNAQYEGITLTVEQVDQGTLGTEYIIRKTIDGNFQEGHILKDKGEGYLPVRSLHLGSEVTLVDYQTGRVQEFNSNGDLVYDGNAGIDHFLEEAAKVVVDFEMLQARGADIVPQ